MFLMRLFCFFIYSSAMEQTLVCAKFHGYTRLFLLQRTGGKKIINFHVAEVNNAKVHFSRSLHSRQAVFSVNISFHFKRM